LQEQALRRLSQPCRHRMARNYRGLETGQGRCQDGDRDVEYRAAREEKKIIAPKNGGKKWRKKNQIIINIFIKKLNHYVHNKKRERRKEILQV
jgi:hypothetical protein